jgi:hypothetical protein
MGRIKTLLSHFYEPGRDEALEAAALVDWALSLETFEERFIEEACAAYLRDPIRSHRGAAVRPGPWDVFRLAKVAQFVALNPPAPPAAPPTPIERCPPERAMEMLVEAGLASEREARRLIFGPGESPAAAPPLRRMNAPDAARRLRTIESFAWGLLGAMDGATDDFRDEREALRKALEAAGEGE